MEQNCHKGGRIVALREFSFRKIGSVQKCSKKDWQLASGIMTAMEIA